MPKGAKTGKDNGFSLLFDIESYDYGYYEEGSEGLKVAIVHHLDMPIIRQRAFHVAPGTENQIPVTPTLYTTNDQVIITHVYFSFTGAPIGTKNCQCRTGGAGNFRVCENRGQILAPKLPRTSGVGQKNY